MEDRSLATIDAQYVEIAPTLTVEQFEKRLADFREFTKRNLREGIDFGEIPGTPKPTLLKPGAEKVMRWYGLVVDIAIMPTSRTDITEGILDFDLEGTVRHARSGSRLGTVHANANSEERRYLNARIPDPDRPDKTPQTIADQKNTILKMGDKRVWVAAALLYTGASEAYTQDLEDSEAPGEQQRPQRGIPSGADAPPGCPGYCAVHSAIFSLVPAGVSKQGPRKGKPYNAFWSCPERGCREQPTPFPAEAPPADDTPSPAPDAPETAAGGVEDQARTDALLRLHKGGKTDNAVLIAARKYCLAQKIENPPDSYEEVKALPLDVLNAMLEAKT